ncbi:unnamed protein product [Ilex paraguariensis]|uniref:Uncharacterized protein n=1 Tax=Ilex paraguariensis TaxID=185542 RepID=A0ABC8SWZ6_9AQUA
MKKDLLEHENSINHHVSIREDKKIVSIFVLIGIILAGAALGYWLVRKFVISEDGSVDAGIAQFVKWAMRVIAVTFIFQSTLDTPLAVAALGCCLSFCSFVNSSKWNGSEQASYYWNESLWALSGGQQTVKHKRAEFFSRSEKKGARGTMWNSPMDTSAWSDSPVKGAVCWPLLYVASMLLEDVCSYCTLNTFKVGRI